MPSFLDKLHASAKLNKAGEKRKYDALTQYAYETSQTEIFNFLIDLAALQQANPATVEGKKLFENFYHNYISTTAKYEINISSSVREEFIQQFNKGQFNNANDGNLLSTARHLVDTANDAYSSHGKIFRQIESLLPELEGLYQTLTNPKISNSEKRRAFDKFTTADDKRVIFEMVLHKAMVENPEKVSNLLQFTDTFAHLLPGTLVTFYKHIIDMSERNLGSRDKNLEIIANGRSLEKLEERDKKFLNIAFDFAKLLRQDISSTQSVLLSINNNLQNSSIKFKLDSIEMKMKPFLGTGRDLSEDELNKKAKKWVLVKVEIKKDLATYLQKQIEDLERKLKFIRSKAYNNASKDESSAALIKEIDKMIREGKEKLKHPENITVEDYGQIIKGMDSKLAELENKYPKKPSVAQRIKETFQSKDKETELPEVDTTPRPK